MGELLRFKPRRGDADDIAIAASIFSHLAASGGVETRQAINVFRSDNPELTTTDLLAGFALARKVLALFQTLLIELARHLHACGSQPVLEALIAVDDGQPLDAVLEDFGRLPVRIYHEVGANEFPLNQFQLVKGRR
jgi:hypothetical protein